MKNLFRPQRTVLLLLLLTAGGFLAAQPVIDSISPGPACAGTEITIFGSSLDIVDQVRINGNTIDIADWSYSAGDIIVLIPDDIEGYPASVCVVDTAPTPDTIVCRNLRIDNKPAVDTINFATSACQGVAASFDLVDVSGSADIYFWDFGNGTSVISQSGDATLTYAYPNSGNYDIRVWVSDDGCFSDTLTLPVTIFALPVATITPPGSICTNQAATFTAASAGGGSTYFWNFGDGTSASSNSTSISHTYASSGNPTTITLIVENANGCSNTTSIMVNVSASLVASITPGGNPEICQGDSLLLTAQPGGATYSWSTGASSRSIWVKSAGTYTVSVSGTCGTGNASRTLIVHPRPSVNLGPDQVLCEGESTTLTAQASGGTPTYTYAWNPGSVSGSSITITPVQNIAYTVTVTDDEGCQASDMLQIEVQAVPDLDISVNGTLVSGTDPIQVFNEIRTTIQLNAGGAGVSWTATVISGELSGFSASGNDASLQPVFVLPENLESAEIEYTVTAQEGDCEIESIFTLEVVRSLFIPNFISPNDDGQNDTWNIRVNAVDEFSQGVYIQIFNRAGAKVYDQQVRLSGNELSEPWDGGACPDGAYWYIISNAASNPAIQLSGAVTLLRGGN